MRWFVGAHALRWLTVPLFASGLAACAGAIQFSNQFSGECERRYEACERELCTGLKDQRDCLQRCAYEARTCQRLQGESVAEQGGTPTLSADQAFLVDLTQAQPKHSSAITWAMSPEAQLAEGRLTLPVGAHVKLSLALPARLYALEMHLVHGSGAEGTNCLVTATVNEQTLLGRYAPPRGKNGGLVREIFDLKRFLPPSEAAGGALEFFLYNNAQAGSSRPYELSAIEFYYRALEAPEEGEEAKAEGP